MYHFDNGYHAEVICDNVDGIVFCTIHVTGNGTDAKIIKLTMAECADTLVRLRDQRASK